jgi:hypothetical protein
MDVRFVHLRRPYRFESPFDDAYVLLLEVTDPAVTYEEQLALSRSIVGSGCRWALCRGVECSSWDDSIDLAFLAAQQRDESRPFLSTTWHDDESLLDTLEFLLQIPAFDDLPSRLAIVEVGGDGARLTEARALLEQLERARET